MSRLGTKDASENVAIVEIAGIMKLASGRNVLRRILEVCGTHGSTFDPDPHKHAYNAGRRAAGLSIEAMLKDAAPGEFETLIREMNNGN